MKKILLDTNMFIYILDHHVLNPKVEKLTRILEHGNLQEMSYIIGSKKEIIKRNLIAGISRGVGIGIGVSVISAMLISLLQRIVTLNIPVIGEYISDIVSIVEKSR